GLLLLEHLLERATLEPLEDHVRHLPAAGGLQHADVARLTDRRRALRQVREQPPLLDEALDELCATVGRQVSERTEDLDGDGSVPDRVPGAVDEGKPTLAHDTLDLVLLRDDRADQLERIRE